jgi:Fe-S-cluster-containing hydrogenase component 2
MPYVIAEPCIGVKDTACIDCGACVPVCPVSAIFLSDDLPEKWTQFTQINANWYAARAETGGIGVSAIQLGS